MIEKKGKLVCANPNCHFKNWTPVEEDYDAKKKERKIAVHNVLKV